MHTQVHTHVHVPLHPSFIVTYDRHSHPYRRFVKGELLHGKVHAARLPDLFILLAHLIVANHNRLEEAAAGMHATPGTRILVSRLGELSQADESVNGSGC